MKTINEKKALNRHKSSKLVEKMQEEISFILSKTDNFTLMSSLILIEKNLEILSEKIKRTNYESLKA